jgi:hypothetical protein
MVEEKIAHKHRMVQVSGRQALVAAGCRLPGHGSWDKGRVGWQNSSAGGILQSSKRLAATAGIGWEKEASCARAVTPMRLRWECLSGTYVLRL